MAHTNGHIPNYTDHLQHLHSEQLRTEAEFYKKLAESYAAELLNIPEAIEEYGYWTCQNENGEVIRLVKSTTGKAEDVE